MTVPDAKVGAKAPELKTRSERSALLETEDVRLPPIANPYMPTADEKNPHPPVEVWPLA
jgi:hypothetical protein